MLIMLCRLESASSAKENSNPLKVTSDPTYNVLPHNQLQKLIISAEGFCGRFRGRFLQNVILEGTAVLWKVSAGGSAEGFCGRLFFPLPHNQLIEEAVLCGRFLRKVPRKVFAEGNPRRYSGFAEGFCGRFRGRFLRKVLRKVPGRFSAEG